MRQLGFCRSLRLWVLVALAAGMMHQVRAEEALPPDDPTPRALLYADFNDPQKPVAGEGIEVRRADFAPGKIGQGVRCAGTQIVCSGKRLDMRRGSVAFWFQPNAKPGMLFHLSSPGRWIVGSFDSPEKTGDTADTRRKGTIGISVQFGAPMHNDTPEIKNSIASEPFDYAPGEWHHCVWAWSGIAHRIYLDGKLAGEKTFTSPLPPEQGGDLVIGPPWGECDVVLDEFATYNFALSPEEARSAFEATESKPVAPLGRHGPTVTPGWGPGIGKVSVAVDVGNEYATAAATAAAAVLGTRGKTLGREKIALRRGFGEAVIQVGPMTPGTYRVIANARDAAGKVISSVTSGPYELPATPWLHNTAGITDAIQPPWTPIQTEGQTLKVSGREYRLEGGFGLPQQITSLGKPLLARPVALEIQRGGHAVPLERTQVKVTESKPGVARWEGTADGGGVVVRVAGRLEYDGMVLLTLRLAPTKGPIPLDAIRLQTAVSSDRALFMFTSADQTYWWYPYRANTPTEPGVFFDNLKAVPYGSRFLPSVVFSDYDRGLEWFAENPGGWQVDEDKPVQEMIRDGDGDVRLQCHLANKPFTLDRPVEITFGYEATPVKPLPPDWRTLYVHFANLGVKSDLALWWSWPDDEARNARQGTFNICPVDIPAFAKAFEPKRAMGLKIAPFTNAHVLLPCPPDNWDLLNRVLKDETQNDGWTAQPTPGFRDYWAYQINRWLDGDGMDAIYIDESYAFGVSPALLSGGYIREDGTHGPGYNLLGVREQLKRTRQLLIDHRKRPLVWLHTTAIMWPHAWAFGDIASDGEAFMFEKPTDPDWIDEWGNKLLEGNAEAGGGGGPWLLSISRAQKFGLMPLFLNYIRFSGAPEYTKAIRAQHGLLWLLDIIPISASDLPEVPRIRDRFGIAEPDVTFHGYWEQTAATAERDDVKLSYWGRDHSALLIVTNLGKERYSGRIIFDLKKLGLDAAAVTVFDPEVGQVGTLPIEAGRASLTVPAHDFRLLQLAQRP